MLFPALTLLTGLAQIALLYQRAPWSEGAAASAALLSIALLFAWTRLRWNSHLDMFLLMLGPGGLGMLLGGWQAGPACHNGTWLALGLMTIGMLSASAPLSWWLARCILQARLEGRGIKTLALDAVGMQVGMLLSHIPAALLSSGDPRLAWLHHGLMLLGMLLGMMAAAALQPGLRGAEATSAGGPQGRPAQVL